mmetsp:Transcript_105962/g.299574  ORF Transcript_105962/g.299574 Transcript_105962/m.299574 type:complete len:559 (+) Transcript_105962:410-2086(+)
MRLRDHHAGAAKKKHLFVDHVVPLLLDGVQHIGGGHLMPLAQSAAHASDDLLPQRVPVRSKEADATVRVQEDGEDHVYDDHVHEHYVGKEPDHGCPWVFLRELIEAKVTQHHQQALFGGEPGLRELDQPVAKRERCSNREGDKQGHEHKHHVEDVRQALFHCAYDDSKLRLPLEGLEHAQQQEHHVPGDAHVDPAHGALEGLDLLVDPSRGIGVGGRKLLGGLRPRGWPLESRRHGGRPDPLEGLEAPQPGQEQRQACGSNDPVHPRPKAEDVSPALRARAAAQDELPDAASAKVEPQQQPHRIHDQHAWMPIRVRAEGRGLLDGQELTAPEEKYTDGGARVEGKVRVQHEDFDANPHGLLVDPPAAPQPLDFCEPSREPLVRVQHHRETRAGFRRLHQAPPARLHPGAPGDALLCLEPPPAGSGRCPVGTEALLMLPGAETLRGQPVWEAGKTVSKGVPAMLIEGAQRRVNLGAVLLGPPGLLHQHTSDQLVVPEHSACIFRLAGVEVGQKHGQQSIFKVSVDVCGRVYVVHDLVPSNRKSFERGTGQLIPKLPVFL